MNEPLDGDILPPEYDQQAALEAAQDDRVLLHVCYGLLVAGYFSGGLTTLIALILGYIKRHPEEDYTFSHLTWVIRTAWITFIGGFFALILFLTIILMPLSALLGAAITIWTVIRIAKGWLLLLDKRPVETPLNLI